MYFFEKFIKRKNLQINLQKLGIGFFVVKIKRTQDEEYSAINKSDILKPLSFTSQVDNLILSLIKNEFDFVQLWRLQVKNLFVDLQGYYRVLKNKSFLTRQILPVYQNLFIKATEKEFNILEENFKKKSFETAGSSYNKMKSMSDGKFIRKTIYV